MAPRRASSAWSLRTACTRWHDHHRRSGGETVMWSKWWGRGRWGGGTRHVRGGGLSPSERGDDGQHNSDGVMGILNGGGAPAVGSGSGVFLRQGEATWVEERRHMGQTNWRGRVGGCAAPIPAWWRAPTVEPGPEAGREGQMGARGTGGRGKGERERRWCSVSFSKRHGRDLRGGGSSWGWGKATWHRGWGPVVAARGGEKGAWPGHRPRWSEGGQHAVRE
jgi:hypothetical protein